MNLSRADLARNTLGVLFIGALIFASVWILRPFLAGFIWAAMIAVSTWPMMRRVEAWCGGRRGPAVAVMTMAMLVVFLIPLGLAISVIVEHAGDVTEWVRGLAGRTLPDHPAWLGGVPLVGPRAVAAWEQAQASGMPALVARIEPYAQDLSRWLLAEAKTFGLLLIQFLLIVILSAVFYSRGEAWAEWLKAFGRRLAEERGEEAMVLAGGAIRGVAMGVVVTAIIQSALGGIGLAIAGVPFPMLLTAIMFVLCIAQLGPILVLIPCVIWMYATVGAGWGTSLLVWSLVVGFMDNFLRPVLIRRGADLPLLLIIVGVIGGLLAFGLVGLFVGPVVLAVTFTLVDAWVTGRPVKQH
jgi:predicted PurR-regulated permease PerM